ncbi:kinase-like domain-containing protein [Aspergillus aurantiobrunneus]
MSPRRLPDLVTDTRLRAEVHESHTRTQRLGGGTFGEVWLEECQNNEKKGQLQVVKILRKSYQFDYYRELEAMAKFSQSTSKYEGFFVKSLGWYENGSFIFIVMEHMTHGNLASHLQKPFPEDEAKQITAQVLEGLAALHENEFVHRDLKPENILVALKGPRWWVKIGYFGFSKRTGENNSLQSVVGTPNYFAPEVLGLDPNEAAPKTDDVRYTCAVDMWSLGVTVFYTLCHEYPFKSGSLLAYIQGAAFPSAALSLHRVSLEGCAFVEALLAVNASTRLSAAAALKDEWLPGLELYTRATEPVSDNYLSLEGANIYDLSLATDASKSWPGVSSHRSGSDQSFYHNINPQKSMFTVSEPSETTGMHPVLEDARYTNAKQLRSLQDFHDKGVDYLANKEYGKAEFMLEHAVTERKATLGPNDKATLASMQQLGIVFVRWGRYSDAHSILQETADTQRQLYGPIHKSTLSLNYWLSKALFGEGRLQEATKYTRRDNRSTETVDAWKDILGSVHSTTIDALESLGNCLYKQQKYEEARSILQRVVEFSSSQRTLTSLHETAHTVFEQLFKNRRSLLGPEHSETLGPLVWFSSSLLLREEVKSYATVPSKRFVYGQVQGLGKTLWYRKDYTEAHALFEAALEGRDMILGSTHQETLDSSFWLGRAIFIQGKYDKARRLLEKTKSYQEDHLGFYHIDTKYSSFTLARILFRDGRLYSARGPLSRAADTFEQSLEPTHPDTFECKRELGTVFTGLHKYKRAKSVLEGILNVEKEARGPTHEETLCTHLALGVNFYEWAGGQIATIGKRDRKTLDTLFWIGKVLYAQKKYQQSEVFLREVADVRKETAITWFAYASEKQLKWSDAVELHQQVFQVQQDILGPSHGTTINSSREVKRCRKEMLGRSPWSSTK